MNNLFSVPKPCHENWDAMTPSEKGRFCSVCSKNVTDFTQMSNEEIVVYLRKNSGNGVCGRFRNDQLEEKVSINIPNRVLFSQTKFRNIFLLALLVTMGSTLFSCMGAVHTTTTTGDVAILPADTLPQTENKINDGRLTGDVANPEDSIYFDSIYRIPQVKKPEKKKSE